MSAKKNVSSKLPPTKVQVAIQIIIFGGGGVFAFGALLDSLSNAMTIVTTRMTIVGTVIGIAIGLYSVACAKTLKRNPKLENHLLLRWEMKHWAVLASIIVLLWVPIWLPPVLGTKKDTSVPLSVELRTLEAGETPQVITRNRNAVGIYGASLDVWPSQAKEKLEDEMFEDVERIKYQGQKENGQIQIETNMPYLSLVKKGGPVHNLTDLGGFFELLFPKFELTILNNTPDTLMASRIEIRVDSSEINPEPLPVFNASPDMTFKVRITNEGWGPLLNARLEFRVLHEDGSLIPGSSTSFVKSIGDIDQSHEVSFEPEFDKLGMNTKEVYALAREVFNDIPHPPRRQSKSNDSYSQIKREMKLAQGYFSKERTAQNALVIGTLHYQTNTLNGSRAWRKLRFESLIPIGLPADGDASVSTGEYDAILRESGKNYTLTVPIAHTIKSGNSDHFTLRLGCRKSSVHKITVALIFTDAREIISLPINLSLLVPRSNIEALKEYKDGNNIEITRPEE